MLGRLSIRAKLTAAFAGAMIVILILAGTFIYLRVGSELNQTLENSLRSRSDNLASLVQSSGGQPPQLDRSLLEGEEGFSADPHPGRRRGRLDAGAGDGARRSARRSCRARPRGRC